MKRRFNYTGRKRINEKDVFIEIKKETRNDNELYYFENIFYFDNLDLPSDTRIYLEAYHRTDYMRFNFGTLGKIEEPTEKYLTEFGYFENIKFRVKLVDESEEKGKLLAMADKIKPVLPEGEDDNQSVKSILAVNTDDIGNKIWELDFDEISKPCLTFNSNADEFKNLSRSDSKYFFLIYPYVIREILYHMIFIDGVYNSEDPEIEWHSYWIQFAREMVSDVPDALNYEDISNNLDIEIADVKEWINNVVNEFCISHNEKWNKVLEGIEID